MLPLLIHFKGKYIMNEVEEDVIDLSEVLGVVKKNLVLFISIVLVCAGISFSVVNFAMEDEYTSTAKIIIVQNNDNAVQNSLTYSEVQLSQKLANTYKQIIMSEAISDTVIKELNLEKYGIDTNVFNSMVTVNSIDNTEVMSVSVVSNDPVLSASIANKTVDVFIRKIPNIMKVENVSVLSNAKIPSRKSGPSVKTGVIIGAVIGIFICAAITLIKILTDTQVKTEEEVKKILDYPIIGNIPEIDLDEGGKGNV